MDKNFKCISINGFSGDRTSYGMEVCHAFAKTLSEYLNIEVEYHGEPQFVADLNWDKALAESNDILTKASSLIEFAFDEGFKPILITPRCATAIATLPQVMNKFPECVVIYFDAHGDVTTPTTSVSGYLGGMPITAAMGVWNSGFGSGVKTEQFIHIGGRDFDSCEDEFFEENKVLLLSKQQIEQDLSELERLIKDKPVFVHIDVDVFEPSEVVAEYAVADGLFRQHIHAIMTSVKAHGILIGLEITEFSPKTNEEREHSYTALFDSLRSLRS
ncbi:MAG: arginase family protein [Pseudohongiella sp.]|uniref:arginase family protein n=1 Tax=Pseudohongiella sp. TaxID=1979412 RepID=UPI00349FD8AF